MTRRKPERPKARAGKVANDHNKTGKSPPTQKNEAGRTPASRHDRDDHLGSANQPRTRRGGPGSSQA